MMDDGHALDDDHDHQHAQQTVPAMQGAAEEDDAGSAAARRFVKSLSELKDLRSQLRHAADHCEAAFLKSTEKKLLVECTQEYVCRAVVTAVDHLGSVSANLNALLLRNAAGASGTAGRLDCLAQRVHTWREYAVAVGLSRVRWNPGFPRYAPRYISRCPFQPVVDGYPSESSRLVNNYKAMSGRAEVTRLESLMALEDYLGKDHNNNNRLSRTSSVADAGPDFSAMLPISGGHSILADPVSPSFSSQTESMYLFTSDNKEKKKKIKRRLAKTNYLLTLVRSKRYSL